MSRRHHHGHPPQHVPDKCTNCGATLDAAPAASALGGFDVVCAFCGHRHHVAAEEPRRPEPPLAAEPQPRAEAPARVAPKVKPSSRVATTVISLVVLLTAGGVAALLVGRRSHGGLGVSWNGGTPIVTTVAGSETLVGRLRDTVGDQLYVGAFDATTLALRWKAGPYGTYTQAYQDTHAMVAGSHVVVTDFHAGVHILDLQSGQEQHVVTLTDKVDSDVDSEMLLQRDRCVIDAGHVWMLQIDKRAVTIDLGSGSVTEAPRPDACNRGMVEVPQRFGPPQLVYEFTRDDFKAPDFESLSMMPFTATSAYVSFGKKAPGTPAPMVAGFDRTSRALRWQVPLPAVDLATVRNGSTNLRNAAVCGDRFVGAYGVGTKSWHLTALDAKTGVRQWDVVLRPTSSVDSLGGVGCSASHVFVDRTDGLDVLDAMTGKSVGTIG